MKYGLVLAGGGVRGAYQVGVWEALTEMGIEIEAITGTSIGAINGALFINGVEEAKKLWYDIAISDIIKLSDDMAKEKNLFNIKNAAKLVKEISANSGLEMTPMEELLKKTIDEDKIRNSPIDFGCSTYSVTDKKEKNIFKKDMENGKLIEYLMASACFVGFKMREINTERFIDGGISNKMPIDMLISKGIKNIIAVDVKGMGVTKPVDISGLNVIKVQSSGVLTGTMDFDTEGIRQYIKEGYFDCKKVFGEYMGGLYSFRTEDYIAARRKYSKELIEGLERAAHIYGIDRFREYGFRELVSLVLQKYKECRADKKMGGIRLIKSVENKTADDILLTALCDCINDKKFEQLRTALGKFTEILNAAGSISYFKEKYEI